MVLVGLGIVLFPRGGPGGGGWGLVGAGAGGDGRSGQGGLVGVECRGTGSWRRVFCGSRVVGSRRGGGGGRVAGGEVAVRFLSAI